MRISGILVAIIPRASILAILVPLFLKTTSYASLVSAIPQLILSGRLDIASIPILLIVSLISCIATLAIPSPSLYTLTIFFASMVALPEPYVRSNLLISIGLYQALAVLFVILIADVLRNHYRGSLQPPITSYEFSRGNAAKGFFVFIAAFIAIPGLVSAYIASYIFFFKLSSASPYVAPLLSFLNGNPVGLILMASIFLGVFYVLTRQAMEVVALYAIPSSRIALEDLSRSVDLKWVRPPLGSFRGFVLSAVITPPIYYIVREVLRIAGIVFQSEQPDLYSRAALWIIGLALFIAIWGALSRSIFSEEREPTPIGIVGLVIVIASVYAISYVAGVSLGFPASSSLDRVLSPIATYYRDAWVVAELVVRAVGAAP